ncbi:unnamed protein product [Cylicostephanus goldi]|uniref:Uncharacterized protein n=1 Tax=Cylicostephanus goldi TaxID=71465 RepID=A0A3P6QRA0_CYLGO|nr:unnamed protein product [Cylicostephanus goldi]
MEKPSSEKIAQFAKVVEFCLKTCNLDGDPDLRAKFLPHLLYSILNKLHDDEKLVLIEIDALLQITSVCSNLLEEISQSGAVEAKMPNGDISETSSNSSPKKVANVNAVVTDAIEKDISEILEQELMESCVNECLLLLASVCRVYVARRTAMRFPLLIDVCKLTSQFLDYPLYCFLLDHQDDEEVPGWLVDVLKVIDADSWIQEMSSSQQTMDTTDLSARTAVLDLVLSIYTKCASVLSQHEAIRGRMAECQAAVIESEDNPTTVLLKPLLFSTQLNKLERDGFFENCGYAVWHGLGLPWCTYEHARMSRLMAILHSRKPNEPSSDMENIIVSALTSSDPVCLYIISSVKLVCFLFVLRTSYLLPSLSLSIGYQ